MNGRNPIVAHEYLGNSVEGKDVFIADDIISSGESMLDIAIELKTVSYTHLLTFDKGRAWMPEVERPKFCRTQNKQSVHKARVLVQGEG